MIDLYSYGDAKSKSDRSHTSVPLIIDKENTRWWNRLACNIRGGHGIANFYVEDDNFYAFDCPFCGCRLAGYMLSKRSR